MSSLIHRPTKSHSFGTCLTPTGSHTSSYSLAALSTQEIPLPQLAVWLVVRKNIANNIDEKNTKACKKNSHLQKSDCVTV